VFYKWIVTVATITESIELFPKDKWVSRPGNEHREATEHLKAAFMAARSGFDDSIKQVTFSLSLIRIFSVVTFFQVFLLLKAQFLFRTI